MTDAEMNNKLSKPIKAVLKAMYDGLNAMGTDEDPGCEFYNKDFFFGFGNQFCKLYVCPETFEIMETALNGALEFIKEEYPVERIERTEDGECLYFDKDGTEYFIGEIRTPGGAKTYDKVALIRTGTESNGYEDEEYIDMTPCILFEEWSDADKMEWCRAALAAYNTRQNEAKK